MKPILIPIEISARHIHLNAEDWNTLFSTPHPTVSKLISQRPQFLAIERADLIGPKKTIVGVGIVGPLRDNTQVELSASDARMLGLSTPLVVSGHIQNAAQITIRGPKGQITVPAAITPKRHIHASLDEADQAGLRDGDEVSIEIAGERGGRLDHVAVRTHPTFTWRVHLDTDEANALGIVSGSEATIHIRP
jgi:putative phosphotransacetylase